MWIRSATTHIFRVILVHRDRLNGNEIINYFINYDYKLDGLQSRGCSQFCKYLEKGWIPSGSLCTHLAIENNHPEVKGLARSVSGQLLQILANSHWMSKTSVQSSGNDIFLSHKEVLSHFYSSAPETLVLYLNWWIDSLYLRNEASVEKPTLHSF